MLCVYIYRSFYILSFCSSCFSYLFFKVLIQFVQTPVPPHSQIWIHLIIWLQLHIPREWIPGSQNINRITNSISYCILYIIILSLDPTPLSISPLHHTPDLVISSSACLIWLPIIIIISPFTALMVQLGRIKLQNGFVFQLIV